MDCSVHETPSRVVPSTRAPPTGCSVHRAPRRGVRGGPCRSCDGQPRGVMEEAGMGELKDTELKDKVALVTGGSRGMGREMVLAFAERGARVVIASRRLESCLAVAEEVERRFGARARPGAGNVTRWGPRDPPRGGPPHPVGPGRGPGNKPGA